MFSNFFTTALRNLFKHKAFSFINIFGLAIGIAASLLILEYARNELSYDRFEPNSSRIYRLEQDRYNNGKLSTQWAAGATGIGPLVKDAAPEVESFARLRGTGAVVSYNDREFRENNMYFTNDAFLSMFSYKALAGSAAGALKDVNSAVITASTARKYFGNEDPIGKTLSLNKRDNFRVTAVVPDPPPNTHLKFDILLSWSTFVNWQGIRVETTMDWDAFLTYILVRPGTDTALLAKKIDSAVHAKFGEKMKAGNYDVVIISRPCRISISIPTTCSKLNPTGTEKPYTSCWPSPFSLSSSPGSIISTLPPPAPSTGQRKSAFVKCWAPSAAS